MGIYKFGDPGSAGGGVTAASMAETFGGTADDYLVTGTGTFKKHYSVDLTAQTPQDWSGDTASTDTPHTVDGLTVTARYTGTQSTYGLTANGFESVSSGSASMRASWDLSDLISGYDPDTTDVIVVARCAVPGWGNTNSYAQLFTRSNSGDFCGSRLFKTSASDTSWRMDRNGTLTTVDALGVIAANGRWQIDFRDGTARLRADESSAAEPSPDVLDYKGLTAIATNPAVFTTPASLRLAAFSNGGTMTVYWLGFSIYTRAI